VLSSNTSGISINAIAQGVSAEHRGNFLGTHFFNPPRVMKLLELIPAKDTNPAMLDAIADFARDYLGKSVVVAKDTGNFIANRIGGALSAFVLRGLEQYGISVSMADFLTGKMVKRPAGTLRTADLVGFDVSKAVNTTSLAAETNDEEKELMKLPDFFTKLIDGGILGDKTKKGFYTRGPNKESLMLDLASGNYVAKTTPEIPALANLKKAPLREQINAVLDSGTPEGKFLWYTLKNLFTYSANRVPEIADDFRKIDLAMRLGYNWELGPFELWDAIGSADIIARMEKDGAKPASWIKEHLAKNGGTFYAGEPGARFTGLVPKYISIADTNNRVLWESQNAVLKDIGDGIGALIITSPHSAMSMPAVLDMTAGIQKAYGLCSALVITSAGKHFCVGADLAGVVQAIQEKRIDDIIAQIDKYHEMVMSIKYAPIPVVAAPFNSALGGGAEICLYCHKIVAYSEFTTGLVEMQVGVIPGGGGMAEMACRAAEYAKNVPGLDFYPVVEKYLWNIVSRAMSSSALNAKELGYLRPTDRIVAHLDRLLQAAKEEALHLSRSFVPVQNKKFAVLGKPAYEKLASSISAKVADGTLTEYDGLLAKKAAFAITGGDVPAGTLVDADTIFVLERESWRDITPRQKTLERMTGLLATGKAVRN
jgi:3-hydroxyacyl-CoA dehydrogenase